MNGDWFIYSQKIGTDAVFRSPDTTVSISGTTTAGFDLATAREQVTFTAAGSNYYLGSSSNYLYRIQMIEDSGLKLLIGHVSTKGVAKKRCVFAGLVARKGGTQERSRFDLSQILHIPLYHDTTSPHRGGEVRVNRTDVIPSRHSALLRRQSTNFNFKIIDYRRDSQNIYLIAKQDLPDDDELVARIIFTQSFRPICIGYHWNVTGYLKSAPVPPTELFSSPTDERCTRGIIGW